MKYLFILLLLINSFLVRAQSKYIQLIDGSKVSVTDNINIDDDDIDNQKIRSIVKRVMHTEIIADIEFCGESVLDYRFFRTIKIEKNNALVRQRGWLLKRGWEGTAYLVKQNNTELYIHSLSGDSQSCDPKKK